MTVAAYHDTSLVKDELFHGYILIFSAERRASLSNLRFDLSATVTASSISTTQLA